MCLRVYCIRGLSVVWANSVRGYETLDAKKTSTWSRKQTLKSDTLTKLTFKAVRLIAMGNQRADSQAGTDQNKPRPIINSQVFFVFFLLFFDGGWLSLLWAWYTKQET